jgi:hypothetical protein
LLRNAKFEDIEGASAKVEDLTGGLGEVDKDICAFGRGEADELEVDGGGEQALVAADLEEGLAGGQGEVEEAAVGGVEETEAVEARLNLEEGAKLAVDEDSVGTELGDPGVFGVAGGVVEELAGGGEVAVVEDEWDFIFSGG